MHEQIYVPFFERHCIQILKIYALSLTTKIPSQKHITKSWDLIKLTNLFFFSIYNKKINESNYQ